MKIPFGEFTLIHAVRDLHDVADKFREEARRLRAEARGRKHIWPWSRDRKLIEANVWEDAARVVDNVVIMDNEKL